MKDLPIRDRNSELEKLSEMHFTSCLPLSWVVNALRVDYGTDLNCEITIDRQVTGKNFSVQLKGKERCKNNSAVEVVLKRSTINRWFNKLEPTMLVVYLADEKEAYWRWFEHDAVDLTGKNETFTVKVSRTNKLSDTDWDSVSDYVSWIFSRKHLLYALPETSVESKTAWELFFKQEYLQALPELQAVLKQNSDDASIFEAIAVCEYQLHNYQKALVYINRALAITQNDSLYSNKAAILTEQGFLTNDDGKIYEAIELYKKIEHSAETYHNIGSAFTKLGGYREAIAYFEKSIALNPNSAEVWNNLGNAYLNLNIHSKEIDCYDRALAINPELPEALFSKGSSLFRYFGKLEKGLKLMLRASSLTDRYELDNPYVFFWIAEAYLAKGDPTKAREWNEKGLLHFSADNYLMDQKQRVG